MSLLTTEEYKAIAASLTFPTTAFIDGHFRPAIGGKTFDTLNPATGEVLAKVAACGAEDVDVAVAKARDAFEDGAKLPDWKRPTTPCVCVVARALDDLAGIELALDGEEPRVVQGASAHQGAV